MSSGFVPAQSAEGPSQPEDDWATAQQAIDNNARRKQEERRETGDASLYEVLQKNKTAKQEAFEESIRLKNQFRTLDDDEVDFLDSVLESTRAQEAKVKKETAEQLQEFRKQCQVAHNADTTANLVADRSTNDANSPTVEETWMTSSRKRRRVKDRSDLTTTKLRKKSVAGADPAHVTPFVEERSPSAPKAIGDLQPNLNQLRENSEQAEVLDVDQRHAVNLTVKPPASNQPLALGLGAYDSEDD